jgi:hypothetical protein
VSHFTGAYAELANGMRLHYMTAGSGPLMLFVHGFPEFWYAWRKQLSEFSGDHRAVALDMHSANNEERKAYLTARSQPGAISGGLNYYRAVPLHPPLDQTQADRRPRAAHQRPQGRAHN